MGSLVSILLVQVLCRLFQAEASLLNSLLPKSVTTAIAVSIAESSGGLPALTAASVIITGIEGAMLAPLFAKVFHVTDPVVEGVAIGACSHAVGTSKALEIGPLQGAMSSIALCCLRHHHLLFSAMFFNRVKQGGTSFQKVPPLFFCFRAEPNRSFSRLYR